MVDFSDHSELTDKPSMYQQDMRVGASKSMPDFSGKVTGRNSKENNWEDQRNTDNWTKNMYDIDEAGAYRNPYAGLGN